MNRFCTLLLLLATSIGLCHAQDEERIPLKGGIRWTEDVSNIEFIWNWRSCEPAWEFTEEAYNRELALYTDYRIQWHDNKYPGTATLEVIGQGKYTGSLFLTFEVQKASEVPRSSDSHYGWWRNRNRVYYCDGFETPDPYYITSLNYADKREEPIIQYRAKDTDEPLYNDLPRDNGIYEVWVTWPECEISYEYGPYYVGDFTVFDYNAQWEALKAMKEPLMALIPEGVEPLPMKNWNLEDGPYSIDFYSWKLGAAADGSIETLYLENSNLQGQFPKEVFLMPGLKELRLYNWINSSSPNILTGRLDDILAEATAEDMPALKSLVNLDLDRNDLTGNIGRVVTFLPKIETLNLNYNRFAEIHPMVNPDIKLGYNYQRLDSIIYINASHPDYDAIIASTPEICKYVHSRQVYDPVYACNYVPYNCVWDYVPNSPITEWSRVSFSHYWWTDHYEFMTRGSWRDAVYYGYNGQMFDCHTTSNDGYSNNYNYMKMVLTYDDYDVNLTDGFDIADIQGAVSYTTDLYFPSFVVNFTEADIVKDGTINVQDIALLITKLLEKEEADSEQQAADSKQRIANSEQKMFFVDATGRLCLSSADPVSAFEITVRGVTIPGKIEALDRLGMAYRVVNTADFSRLVVYTFNKEKTIPTGVLPLFDADDATSLRGIATDFDGMKLLRPFDAQTEGIEDIAAPIGTKIATVSGRTLHFANMPLDNLSWRVISVQGREMARGTIANGCCATADLPAIPSGMYIVEVSADGIAPATIKTIIK